MKNEMREMTKMRKMRLSDCSLKEYVKNGSLYEVRKTWEARSYMVKVAGNYPGHRRYEATGWLCQACDLMVREDQDHLATCTGYSDLVDGKNIHDDKDFVEFFSLVMARREERGWQ